MLITNPPELVPQRISQIRDLVGGDRIQIARSRQNLSRLRVPMSTRARLYYGWLIFWDLHPKR